MRILVDEQFNLLQPDQGRLAPFLGIPYQAEDVFEQARKQISSSSYPRQELVTLLHKYNTQLGNDGLALHNISRLALSETACIVTGQQLGLMGGPAYTILKGISCLLAARESGSVPVFWLATEDHDVAEIDHTYLLDAYGNLNAFHLSLPKDGRCVEDLKLTQKNIEVIHHFLKQASIDKDSWPDINDSYAHTMASCMVKLFAGTGMVFIEPHLLRPLAGPFFRREIEEYDNFQYILQDTTARLKALGGQPNISFNGSTNLFLKDSEGHRRKIHVENDTFIIGKQSMSRQDLLSLIEGQPQRFSTNVAARPVLQSLLIPTLAYIAGPSELAYYRQLKDYHLAHGVPMPCIIPRLSATFIPVHAAEIAAKCQIDLSKEFSSHWTEILPQLEEGLPQIKSEMLQSALLYFGKDMPIDMLERFVRQSVDKLHKKVIKKRLQNKVIPSHGLHLLHNLIHPHHKQQERVLNWWAFQGYSSENILNELLKLPSWRPQGHLYCYCQ